MNRWTVWDWVGRIGMYLVISAIVHFAGWYGFALIAGILLVILAISKLDEKEKR